MKMATSIDGIMFENSTTKSVLVKQLRDSRIEVRRLKRIILEIHRDIGIKLHEEKLRKHDG
jgi:hypothetical protein